MKTKIFILTLALCASGLALAADQPADGFASASTQKKAAVRVANPFAQTKLESNNKEITRLGGMSSRPWTQIVGWHPGEPSSFMDAKTHEPQLRLLWIGAEPQP